MGEQYFVDKERELLHGLSQKSDAQLLEFLGIEYETGMDAVFRSFRSKILQLIE